MKRMHGTTLPELIICISIIAIATTASIPSLINMITQAQRTEVQNSLIAIFALARQEAIKSQRVLTLCPLDSNNQCGKDWNNDLSVFHDPSNERKLTNKSNLVRVLTKPSHGTIKVQSLSKSHFQYHPNGMIFSDLGNITWCPPSSADPSTAVHIIISRGGRIRAATDKNGDGIVDTASGKPLPC